MPVSGTVSYLPWYFMACILPMLLLHTAFYLWLSIMTNIVAGGYRWISRCWDWARSVNVDGGAHRHQRAQYRVLVYTRYWSGHIPMAAAFPSILRSMAVAFHAARVWSNSQRSIVGN